jgi:hypothetical protein
MHLTIEEHERGAYISGTPLHEDLIDAAILGESVPRSVGDITAGYPDEGFLDEAINSLKYLIKTTHKNNKLLPELKKIVVALTEKQNEIAQAVEYGYEEVKKLKSLLHIF